MKKPPALKTGDKVGIFVPSSAVKQEYRQRGLKEIENLGFVPVEVSRILDRVNYWAKPASQNLDDLQMLLLDNEIKALWAARGGYGANYLLPLLGALKIDAAKIIIGSSDVSYLLWYFMAHHDMVVFYGPMVYASLAEGRVNPGNINLILGGGHGEVMVSGKVLRAGQCRGLIFGGCLSIYTSLIGTYYQPVLDNKIVLFEDVNERPYRLDRMLWQIAEAGLLRKIRGLMLGEFPGCFNSPEEKGQFLANISRMFRKTSFPIIYDLPFGHSSNTHMLPLGVQGEIHTGIFAGLVIKESGVQS